MHTVEASRAQEYIGEQVKIQGHVLAVRRMGGLLFLVLRDRTGIIQAVSDGKDLIEKAAKATAEMPVIAEGLLVTHPGNGKTELKLTSLDLLSEGTVPPPVEIAKQNKMETLSQTAMLDYRPLTVRSPWVRAIFKIEAVMCEAFRAFLRKEGFTEIHSPKIVSTGTEGGAQLFKLDYFGRQAFLAQSPQFYKQIMVGAFERVFEVGPVYRAEEHDTTRHLNEYISMDVEMGFIESEQTLMALQTRLLRHIFASVEEECAEELALYGAKVPRISEIPQITFAQAVQHANELKGGLAGGAGGPANDLDPEGERLLCQEFLKTHGTELVYVTRYPLEVRPFYAMGHPGETQMLSKSFDLLFRGLEITTGGQRIHKPAELRSAMEGRGLVTDNFKDYLQCFDYGMPPHGGFAIGLERLAKQLLNLPSVKLTALFPRDLNRLTP